MSNCVDASIIFCVGLNVDVGDVLGAADKDDVDDDDARAESRDRFGGETRDGKEVRVSD